MKEKKKIYQVNIPIYIFINIYQIIFTYTHFYPYAPVFSLKAHTNSIAYTTCKKQTMNSLNGTEHIMKIFCNYSLLNKKVSEFSNEQPER